LDINLNPIRMTRIYAACSKHLPNGKQRKRSLGGYAPGLLRYGGTR
jgi:hypothetical protein